MFSIGTNVYQRCTPCAVTDFNSISFTISFTWLESSCGVEGKQTVATNAYSSGPLPCSCTLTVGFHKNSHVHEPSNRTLKRHNQQSTRVLMISGQLPPRLALNTVGAVQLDMFPDCPFFKAARSHCWHHPWRCCPCRSGRVPRGRKMPAWSTAPPRNSLRCGRLEWEP